MKTPTTHATLPLTALAAVCALALAAGCGDEDTTPTEPSVDAGGADMGAPDGGADSLYDRLGGEAGIQGQSRRSSPPR